MNEFFYPLMEEETKEDEAKIWNMVNMLKMSKMSEEEEEIYIYEIKNTKNLTGDSYVTILEDIWKKRSIYKTGNVSKKKSDEVSDDTSSDKSNISHMKFERESDDESDVNLENGPKISDHESKNISDSDKNQIYKCTYCLKIYESIKELDEHNNTRCVDVYMCKLCGMTFERRLFFDRHMKRKIPCVDISANKNKDDRYVCSICNKEYTNVGNLNVHKKSCITKNHPEKIIELELRKHIAELEEKYRILEYRIKKLEDDKLIENSDNKRDLLVEMNKKDNKILVKFNSEMSSLTNIRKRFKDKDLSKLFNLLKDKKCDELTEYIIEKIHFSEDNPSGQNIRYISDTDGYIIYDNQWIKRSSAKVLDILQCEVAVVMLMVLNYFDKPKDPRFIELLRKNMSSLDVDQYPSTQTNAVKIIQNKYDNRK